MKRLRAAAQAQVAEHHDFGPSSISDTLWRIYYENDGPGIMFNGSTHHLMSAPEVRAVPVDSVRFSHNEIRTQFANGEHSGANVTDLIADLDAGRVDPCDSRLQLKVVRYHGELVSINNRRLFALREHQKTRKAGHTVFISVLILPLCPVTAKFVLSYTTMNGGMTVSMV